MAMRRIFSSSMRYNATSTTLVSSTPANQKSFYTSEEREEDPYRVLRDLSPSTVLKTVRQDPGMSTTYYAKRYFGSENTSQLNHILWTELKKFGKLHADRKPASTSSNDSTEGEVTWHPLRTFKGRHHEVRMHKSDDEDLSLLQGFVPQVPDFLISNPPQPPKIPTITK